jgi:uncharacterized membrane protein
MQSLKRRLLNFADNVSPVKFFITVALTFGLIFAIITPPFQTADETVHFLRAYQVSQFNFVPDQVGQAAGGYLPQSVGDTIVYTMTRPNVHYNPSQKYNIYKTFHAASFKTQPNKTKLYDFSSTSYYPPMSYLPQASGILLARTINLPPVDMMYAGRLMNLLVWVALLALSIYLIPRKKWALVAVALLPMAVFQSISLGTDVITVGLTALLLALVLNLRERDRTLNNKQLAALLLILVCLVLSKQIMFLLLPLVLLIPNKILGKSAILKKILLIIIPLILFGAWMLAVKDIGSISNPINHQNPVLQTKFIIHNPHSFINVLWNTYFFNWSDIVTASFIGTFGWQDTPLSELLIMFGYLSLAFLFFASYGSAKEWVTKKQKMLLALIGVVYWLAVSTALYVYYSPVGYKIIVGMQGRYFLPLAILAIPIFYGNWLKTTKTAYRRIAVFAPLVLLVASVITIYVRYYVNNV